jgi:hypothetical protein
MRIRPRQTEVLCKVAAANDVGVPYLVKANKNSGW